MKPLAVPPDAERIVVDYLTTALAARGQDVTVGVSIPITWSPLPISQGGSKPHVQVGHDGTPSGRYPITAKATVRLTAWASSTTAAKTLAGLVQGLLLIHPGGGGVGSTQFLTGNLPARDPSTGAQLASNTTRINLIYSVLA